MNNKEYRRSDNLESMSTSPIKSNQLTPSKSNVEALSGYVALGMKREALKLAIEMLAKPRIKPMEFNGIVEGILVQGSMKDLRKCRELIEAAYIRQAPRTKKAIRNQMLLYYYTISDNESALSFLSSDEVKSDSVPAFALMDLFLEAERTEEAKRLAVRCEKLLRAGKQTRFEASILLEALARYYSRTAEWDKALQLWQMAPLEQPFRRDALSGIVRTYLAYALDAIRIGLGELDDLMKHSTDENALALPHNDDEITYQAKKELLWFKRGIKKLLPKSGRKELGMDTDNA